jgi:hypothetical protein
MASEVPRPFVDIAKRLGIFKKPKWMSKTTEVPLELEMSDCLSSEGTTPSNSSISAEESSRTLSPATTISTVSRENEGKGHEVVPLGIVNVIDFSAFVPHPQQHNLPMSECEEVPDEVSFTLPTATQGNMSSNFALPCPKCNLTFRTPGQLRYVSCVTVPC